MGTPVTVSLSYERHIVLTWKVRKCLHMYFVNGPLQVVRGTARKSCLSLYIIITYDKRVRGAHASRSRDGRVFYVYLVGRSKGRIAFALLSLLRVTRLYS